MGIRRWLFQRWDKSNCLFGNIVVASFVMTQCLDGVFTYVMITDGVAVEKNPLVNWMMSVMGIELALVAAKTIGIGSGILLYRLAAHRMLLALTVIYLVILMPVWIRSISML